MYSCNFNEQSAATFSSYMSNLAYCPPHFTSINDVLLCFNEFCKSALDFYAPYTFRAVPIINTTPWINDNW